MAMSDAERAARYKDMLLQIALETSPRGMTESIVRSAINTMAAENDLEGVPAFLANDETLLGPTRKKIADHHESRPAPPALNLDEAGKEARAALYQQFDSDKRATLKMVRDGVPPDRIYRYGFRAQMKWLGDNGLINLAENEVTVLGAHVSERVLKKPVDEG